MIEKYRLLPEKVHCVYEAEGERVYDRTGIPTAEEIRRKYHLPATYGFYPANMWPHKNHLMLILALHRLRQAYGKTLSLVLTGDDMGQWAALEELAKHFHLQGEVRYLGYVDADEVSALYRGAAMLIFPSLFEGFGIPLVEAMALGCPIAAADTASIPEVVGDAALLFDPRNPDALADACYRLLTCEELRQTLIVRGRQRAARFSWARAADETLQVLAWAHSQRRSVRSPSRSHRARIDGLYPDGWAGRRVRLHLPYLPDTDAVKIEGFANHHAYPQSLRMKVNGRSAHQLSLVEPGIFTFRGKLHGLRVGESEMEIEFFAERDFIPAEVESSSDTRRLAYRIEKLSLIVGTGVEIPLYSLAENP
jgi:hypothetical protein